MMWSNVFGRIIGIMSAEKKTYILSINLIDKIATRIYSNSKMYCTQFKYFVCVWLQFGVRTTQSVPNTRSRGSCQCDGNKCVTKAYTQTQLFANSNGSTKIYGATKFIGWWSTLRCADIFIDWNNDEILYSLGLSCKLHYISLFG